ncbi:hypothetical protein IE81DRAFT_339389 [Ceraceosorus guamensis]|uniref:Palmitoyltransferase n=1 Tax=Ceraceosorus guamensis TaxID=1522189 RepID=A0A316WD56_9BASI|nr:hypothetical protein IE81DRAFT_339389 [Ceraceosorus guamensis]PWN45455.1 hypothetical protein IE81DRAFT_339389 [Ceraceosorus guamensis]
MEGSNAGNDRARGQSSLGTAHSFETSTAPAIAFTQAASADERVVSGAALDPVSIAPTEGSPISGSTANANATSGHPKGVDESMPGCIRGLQKCRMGLEEWSDNLERKEIERRQRRRRARRGSFETGSVSELEQGRLYGQARSVTVEGSQVVQQEAPGTGKATLPSEPGYGRTDHIVVRKGMVPMVFIIIAWVYLVHVWRLCAPAIRQTDQALTSRATGGGLLAAQTVLMLMTLWTYLKAMLTPPGYVRDHVGVSDCPPPAADEYYYDAPWVPTPQPATYGADGAAGNPSRNDDPHNGGASAPGEEDIPVDPSLPAIVGPMAASAIAASRVEDPTMTKPEQAIPPCNAPVAQAPAGNSSTLPPTGLIPRPVRMPPPRPILAPVNRYCHRCCRVRPPRAHHCRRCGTCVLKMDHHCPWVGGCVGARNIKFFYNFVTWVTMWEIFMIVSGAVLFSRGVAGQDVTDSPYRDWRVDGFVISMFVLCGMFFLFTGSLFATHTYMYTINSTTLEHMAFERHKATEAALLDAYFSDRGQGGKGLHLKEKHEIRKEWDSLWGRVKKEGNLWWLDGASHANQSDANGAEKNQTSSTAGREASPAWTNFKQVIGDEWYGWLLPIGKSPSDGRAFPQNPRHSALGVWRPRRLWPNDCK